MKVGDAKLWVYDYESNYDCQAAEDHSFCSRVYDYGEPGYMPGSVVFPN
jgi:hypothetical protein